MAELEKMEKIKEKAQTLGNFLEWLKDKKGWVLCKYFEAEKKDDEDGFEEIIEPSGHYVQHYSTEELLAEFFNIDLKKVEEEKREILEDIRNKNRG